MALPLPGKPLALLVILAAISAPWYLVGQTLANAKPAARSSLTSSGVVWGDRVFTSRGPLAAWLHFRGVAYVVWGRRHPLAWRTLER
jgi:hypothetical protein